MLTSFYKSFCSLENKMHHHQAMTLFYKVIKNMTSW